MINFSEMKILNTEHLKKHALIKAMQVGVVVSLMFPAIVLKIFERKYDLHFFYDIGVTFMVMFPIVFGIVYLILWAKHKCSACKGSWSYNKVKEEVANIYIQQNPTTHKKRKIKELIIEYQCSICHFIKLFRKKRKIRVS